MATLRAGKLARKKNSRFQSTAVKSKTRNFLDSRKTKSRVIALMMLNNISVFGIILFSYSSSLCCKSLLKKKITSEKKVTGKKVFVAITRGHKIVSSRSRTRGIFVVSAFPRRVPVS